MLGLRILAVSTLAMTTFITAATATPPRPAIPWTETEMAPAPAPVEEIDGGPRAFGPGVQAAADHLVALQCADGLAGGGWGWPAICPPMYHNLTGPIGLGLLHAHSLTLDASHLAAAVAGGDFDLAGTAARFPDNSGTWFGSFGPAFFHRLSTAAADSAYADNAAADFFDRLTASTYGDPAVSASWPGDTYDWIARLQAGRSGGLINLRPWDLHQLPWVAQSLGNPHSTGTDGVAQSTAFLNAMLDGLDTLNQDINPNTDFGDVIGIAGAVHGLALAGTTSFTAIDSPDHLGIDGIATLCDLADYLASLQNADGSWYWHSNLVSPGEDSKSVQETAYAVLALSAAQASPYLCGPYTSEIAAARDWLRSMQLPNGGFRAYPGGGEYAEISAEALSALQLESCTSNVLKFLLAAGSDCVQPGETVVVELHQRDLAQLVRGFQAFAQFDSSAMSHVSNVFTSVPYGLALLNTVSGDDIDLAAGIDNIFGGQTPTAADALLVTLSFTAGATEGNTWLSFRTHDPATYFTDEFGGQVTACLVESPPICIDGTDPTIDCSGMDITAFNDADLCSAVVDPGTPVADDDGCGTAPVITGVRSDALGLNDPYPADCQCGLLAGAYNTSSLSENDWYSDDTRADGTGSEVVGTNLVSNTLTDDPEASATGTPAHDADIQSQILFGTAPGTVPPGTHTGAVHLQIAAGAGSGKSQISHRKDDGTGHAPGSVFGPGFAAEYHWMGDGTVSVTASLKFGIKTSEFGSTGPSPRTGENVWDKVLIYEPGNLNGGTSDGLWHTETISHTSGTWWFFDRTAGAGIIGTPMTLEAMSTSAVVVGGGPKTVADVYALITAPGAHITSVQFGIGSANAGGSVYVNQLETNFYRSGERTTFGCDPGTTTITWTATDCAGNTATCQQVITVVDNEGPDITCPDDAVVSCDASTDPSNTGEASATDNCDASPDISYDDDVASGDCAQESFITRTWTATDDCGNASTCEQLITIVDSTAPVITCPDDVVVDNDPGECSAALTPGPATATDNCDPAPVVTGVRSDALPLTDPYPVGLTNITWTATDDCGNDSQCKQTITVLDTEPPVLTPGSIDDCYETAAEAEADAIAATGATDNCTDFGDLDFAAATVGDCAATVTVTVTDLAGNSSEVQYATQIDDTDPVITCPDDISLNADAGLCTALLDFVEEFDANPSLCASQTPDCWYVDRYAPATFASAFFDGDNRLHHAISAADSIGNRPGGFQSTFYNYQGRKYDVDMPLDTELSIDLYIPADWETDARHASLWATTFDSDNAISGFPILAFTANDPADELNPNPLPGNVVPRFRVFTQDTDNDPGNGYTPGWVNLGLPAGFLYNQWVTYKIKLTATAYEFRVVTAQGDLTYTDNITFGSIRFGNIILQAYNFGSLPTYPVGDSYDVYWDNVTLGPEGPFVTDNCGVVSITYERSDNALLTLFDPFPTGTTDVVWTATDCAGNSASCTQTVTVSGFNEMVVTVELSPTMAPGPLTRCITFDLRDCPGGAPLATVTADLEFVGGLATATLDNVPCGAYSCITARDTLHTLRRTDEAFGIVGTQYVADFTGNPSSGGDWLIGGNLNDDNWIDILDFGVYSFLFGTVYGSGDTPCGTLAPQADINGNGIVFTEDFTFIAINFLKGNEANCCAALLGPDAAEPGPVISITVEELVRRGLGHLAAGDLNRDAVLDVQDIVAFMQGARPAHRPRPRPLQQEELAPLQTPPGAAPAAGPAPADQNVQQIR